MDLTAKREEESRNLFQLPSKQWAPRSLGPDVAGSLSVSGRAGWASVCRAHSCVVTQPARNAVMTGCRVPTGCWHAHDLHSAQPKPFGHLSQAGEVAPKGGQRMRKKLRPLCPRHGTHYTASHRRACFGHRQGPCSLGVPAKAFSNPPDATATLLSSPLPVLQGLTPKHSCYPPAAAEEEGRSSTWAAWS